MSVNPRRGLRVLVGEDEPLIAMEIEEVLSDAGFESVQLAATVEQALLLVEADGCDAAVLDANLGGMSAEPVAAALRQCTLLDQAIQARRSCGRACEILARPRHLWACRNGQAPYNHH